jgi:hypothetical protein
VDAHDGSITLREMGNIRRLWRDGAVAEAFLQGLERAGHGEVVLDPPGPNGGGRHLRFRRIDDRLVHATPENPENSEVACISSDASACEGVSCESGPEPCFVPDDEVVHTPPKNPENFEVVLPAGA